jgi:hypothetical protein
MVRNCSSKAEEKGFTSKEDYNAYILSMKLMNPTLFKVDVVYNLFSKKGMLDWDKEFK